MAEPVTGLLLAAGQSKRMGATNKLTELWRGKPLVAHAAEAALESRLSRVVVVTGHEPEQVAEALPDGCIVTHNRDFAEGMASSIRWGLYRMQGYGPVLVLLGDMPLVTAAQIDAMLDAFHDAHDDRAIIVATSSGARGNPVLFGKAHFPALKLLDGDQGARRVIEANRDHVRTVEIGAAAERDFDTPAAFVGQATGPNTS